MPDRLDILLAELALLPCPGGAERFAFELLAELRTRHRVRAVVAGDPEPVAGLAALAPEVELVAGPLPSVLEDDPPDVVVSHLAAADAAIPAASEAGIPSMLLLPSYGALSKPALSSASCVVAASRALAAACEELTGRRPEVAPPVVRAAAAVSAHPAGPVVFVSSMWTRQKGAGLVTPIAARLVPRPVVVRAPNGFPEDERAALEALPNVTLDPSSSDIGDVLEGGAALVVPAQGPEGFCRVAFEGMAAGVPTLASAVPGLTELVPDEQLVRGFAEADAWSAAAAELEHERAWSAARDRGLRAAERVLALDSPAKIERRLRHAVIHQAAA